VFENRVLRRIFGPKRDEVMEEWRKLHSGRFIILLITRYYWADQIKENTVVMACGMRGSGEKSVQGFGGKA
jgi:hypothetical protein